MTDERRSSDAYDEETLREALTNLFVAAQGVIACWEQGDLAGAVHMLEGAVDDARPYITTGEDE